MKSLPANRVVLALQLTLAVLGAAATSIGAATDSLPHAWAPDIAYLVAFLGVLGAITTSVLKFLDGSQKSEALQANAVSVPEAPDDTGVAPDEWRQARYPEATPASPQAPAAPEPAPAVPAPPAAPQPPQGPVA